MAGPLDYDQPTDGAPPEARRSRGVVFPIFLSLVVLGLLFAIFWKPPVRVSPAQLGKRLSSDDAEVVGNTLRGLTDSRDPAGIPMALPLLKHPDPYVWVNAALYLGTVRRPETVPYLIKAGLREFEWAYAGAERDLHAITGKNFGRDFQKWREWWEKANPDSAFDFGDRPPPHATSQPT